MRRSVLLLPVAALPMAGLAQAVEVDVDVIAGGTAPLTEVLRKTYPGASLGVQLAWGATAYLDVGARYGLGIFPQQAVDAQGNEQEPVLDHSLSALVALTLVSGEGLGWLEPGGSLGSDLRVDIAVGWHRIGREDCAGFDVGLAWLLRIEQVWNVGPVVRTVSVFGTSQGTAAYVVFGLQFGYDFGGVFRSLWELVSPAPEPAPAPAPAPRPAPAPAPWSQPVPSPWAPWPAPAPAPPPSSRAPRPAP